MSTIGKTEKCGVQNDKVSVKVFSSDFMMMHFIFFMLILSVGTSVFFENIFSVKDACLWREYCNIFKNSHSAMLQEPQN